MNGKGHKKEMLIQSAIVGFQSDQTQLIKRIMIEVQTTLMNNLKEQVENILKQIKEMVFGFH